MCKTEKNLNSWKAYWWETISGISEYSHNQQISMEEVKDDYSNVNSIQWGNIHANNNNRDIEFNFSDGTITLEKTNCDKLRYEFSFNVNSNNFEALISVLSKDKSNVFNNIEIHRDKDIIQIKFANVEIVYCLNKSTIHIFIYSYKNVSKKKIENQRLME